MELSQLEVFLAVAREGPFSRAAEKLLRTQSAVSQTIRKLEDELGEALFDRSSREGVLTDAGKRTAGIRRKAAQSAWRAAGALAELRELQKGKLVIAANEFTALYLLPVLAEFRRLHPMIKITVQRSLGSHIPDDVLRHSAEMGVLSYDPQEPQPALHCRLPGRIDLRGSAHAPAGVRQSRSASGNWARSHSSLTLSPRPIARKSFSIQDATKHRCTWTSNCPPCRPSSDSWPWGKESHWCRRSAWKPKLPEANWSGFRCVNCGSTANCA